ncbi:NUDIX domain-containing protein [Candidatus Saccharibacteria bacterium]|nr:NUDIX domain-containing protein [Candidatus Saccharibacteria bacterium]NCU40306.1 NUDIX domain-containing protein [Candidatus Saccharibacteria bacterium]
MIDRPLPKKKYKLIPEEATKVFEGVLFDVYQWQQKMFDDSYKTFEMLKRADTVLVIAVDDQDRVVVITEEQPGLPLREYRLPGGRVDPQYKSVLDAAQHELVEETGIECAQWQYIETVQPEIKIEWFLHVFLASNIVAKHKATPDIDGEIIHEIHHVPYVDLRSRTFDTTRISVIRRCEALDDIRREIDN